MSQGCSSTVYVRSELFFGYWESDTTEVILATASGRHSTIAVYPTMTKDDGSPPGNCTEARQIAFLSNKSDKKTPTLQNRRGEAK